MRCYFYLTDGDETIRDDHGVEVSDLESARRFALRAIVELRRANPRLAAAAQSGWTLVAFDDTGAIVFMIPLREELPN
jgi:hypothetical protein